MARPALTRPTDAELAILRVLWRDGPSTVRHVHDALAAGRPAGDGPAAGYTGVLKLMQIMTDKRLVARDARAKTHVYRPAAPEADTQRQLVGDLLDRAFGGSARALILHALSARRASPDDLAEIQRLIDDQRRRKPPPPK